MSPLLTVLADDLVEPVAPGWQLITATLVAIALLVILITVVKLNPFLALILGGLTVGIIAGGEPERRHRVVHHRVRDHRRRRRGADRAGRDLREAARRLRWRRPGRRHDRRPRDGTVAAVGDGGRRGDHRAADVLRDRPRAADAGDLPGGAAGPGLAHHGRHPGPGRAVRDARLRAAAPRTGHRDRAAARRPGRDPGPGDPGRDPDDHRRRTAVRQHRRTLGGGRGAEHVRHRRPAGAGRRGQPSVVRRHDRDHPPAGRADARQGAGRHRDRRHRGRRPEGARRHRQPVHRPAGRRTRRDVDLRRAGRDDAVVSCPARSRSRCRRSPGSC